MGGSPPQWLFKMVDENRSKKIFGAIVLVVGVVILIAISSLVVGSFLGASVFTDTVVNGTEINETLSEVNATTTQNFAILSTYPTGTTCVLGIVTNSTDGVVINSANYTQPTTCQILSTAGSEFLGFDWNITYAWSNTDEAILGLNATELTDGFSAFVLGIITFLGIIGIIIGIVWIISYLKPLFSKDEGIQSFAGN